VRPLSSRSPAPAVCCVSVPLNSMPLMFAEEKGVWEGSTEALHPAEQAQAGQGQRLRR